MANRRVLIFRELDTGINLHDVVRAGDTIVDDAGNELFVLGVTPRINLPEYDNTNPADGDIWYWDDELWTHMNGVTYRIRKIPNTPPLPSSSLSSVVPPAPASSALSSSSAGSSSSVFSSSSHMSSSVLSSSSSSV